MKKKRKKIIKLNDEQYNAYIMSLKENAALYDKTGEMWVPDSLKHYEDDDSNR